MRKWLGGQSEVMQWLWCEVAILVEQVKVPAFPQLDMQPRELQLQPGLGSFPCPSQTNNAPARRALMKRSHAASCLCAPSKIELEEQQEML